MCALMSLQLDINSMVPCHHMSSKSMQGMLPLVNGMHLGTDIRTSPLASASEFLKKGLSGKYVLVFTCPNEICKQCNKTEKKLVFKSLNP